MMKSFLVYSMKNLHNNVKTNLEDEFVKFKKIAPFADKDMFKKQ
jgi:hypothetical protein